MLSQFEVFIKCPATGNLVSTGATTKSSTFGENEKPYGAFNCPACGAIHTWDHKQAEIHMVHK